jgi:DNA repair exonuclease SbcCD ATPase subunit
MSKHKTDKGLVDVDKALRSKDQDKIKELEKQIIGYQDEMRKFDDAKKQYDKQVRKFEKERAEKEACKKTIKDMQQKIDDQVAITADVNQSL